MDHALSVIDRSDIFTATRARARCAAAHPVADAEGARGHAQNRAADGNGVAARAAGRGVGQGRDEQWSFRGNGAHACLTGAK